MLKFISIDSSI